MTGCERSAGQLPPNAISLGRQTNRKQQNRCRCRTLCTLRSANYRHGGRVRRRSMAAQYAGRHHRSANWERMATSTGRPAHQDHRHCADASCPTPVWGAFLARITDNRPELSAYLQRIAGYSLTGATQEHALFFLYGLGANGKTTFLNAITACVGNYHRTAPIETFTASSVDRHPTDLAGLRGARLVTAIETEEGRRWAESRIKSLTGGDKISARFMRQDFFEYTPQFKLIIAGNHKPGLKSVDEAIRRRFNLIPFTVTIPPDERDEALAEKLKAELPGIMQWMIDGCMNWQERGLAPPEVVTKATAAYLEAEDALAAWIEEAGQRDPNAWEKSSDLFASWAAWATKAGEYFGPMKRFLGVFETKGFTYERRRDGRGYRGLRLNHYGIGQ